MSRRLRDPRYRVAEFPLNNHPDDVSGYGNNLTWVGTEAYDPFFKNSRQAGEFDGASYARRAIADWRSADSQGTFAAWVKPSTIAKAICMISSSDEATDNYIIEWSLTNAGKQFLYVYEAGGVIGSATGTEILVLDDWQHIAVVSYGDSYGFYLNGQIDAVAGGGTDSGAWLGDVAERDNIVVGGLVYNSGPILEFEGVLANVQAFNVPLTQDEVLSLYHTPVPTY